MNSFWRCLEEVQGVYATYVEWKTLTGSAFEAFKTGFLGITSWSGVNSMLAKNRHFHFITQPCGRGSIRMCEKESGCGEIPLTVEDLRIWYLDRPRLCRAIAWALESEPVKIHWSDTQAFQIASFAEVGLPVLMFAAADFDSFRQAVSALVTDTQHSFILIGPTTRFLDDRCKDLLEKSNAQFLDLESNFFLRDDGRLEVCTPPRELFARFLPGKASNRARALVAEGVSVFSKAGRGWKVVYDGCPEFILEDTLGARYLDYLLHHPNESILAFDLEVIVTPEKGKARNKNSIQEGIDCDAVRNYLRCLEKLRAERDKAEEDGRQVEVDRLDDEIELFAKELKKAGKSVDTGERARGNVSKAITAVHHKLLKRSKHEKAFGEHIAERVSLGYSCSYESEQGGIWGVT